jgi:hypothetical protein
MTAQIGSELGARPLRASRQPLTVLAIDPGPVLSAWVVFDGQVLNHGKDPNARLVDLLRVSVPVPLVLEQLGNYGMNVGKDVLETAYQSGWIAAHAEQAGYAVRLIPRRDVKLHLCDTARVNDTNVRQAVLDRFGGKATAIGTRGKKGRPGPLAGLKADEWQALALAITFHDQLLKETHAREQHAAAFEPDAADFD